MIDGWKEDRMIDFIETILKMHLSPTERENLLDELHDRNSLLPVAHLLYFPYSTLSLEL